MISDEQVKKVLDLPRSESDSLNPFYFKKISLKHVEIDKEIILKFRLANELTKLKIKEKYGTDALIKVFERLDTTVILDICFELLTAESRKEIALIGFTDCDEDGNEEQVDIPPKDKFKMLFVSDTKSIMEILDMFLSIYGYTKDQLKLLFGEEEKVKKKANP